MNGAEQLHELNSEALAALGEFEGRVSGLEAQLEALRSRLDVERRQLTALREEVDLRYLYSHVQAGGAALDDADSRWGEGGPDLDAIRTTEQELGEQVLRCAAFASKLSALANLLLVSRGQFAPRGEASNELDVWELVARIATIKAQEEERSRLAREVHDGPAQVLANAILGLELCEQIARRAPEQLIDEIARLKGMVREGLVEVRRFIFDLRPSGLAERGLLATLQRYVAEYRTFFRLDVALHFPADVPPLTQEQQIAIFRIIQESLQNIQKHARASQIIVGLELDDSSLVATIRDDGRGFLPRQIEVTTLSGAGLRGMGERAAAIGGELQVESQPGEGTTIRLVLPLTTATPASHGA